MKIAIGMAVAVMRYLYLLILFSFSVAIHLDDSVLESGRSGTDVVLLSVAYIQQACPDDNKLLRRIADVETRDGNDANEFNHGNSGGIWGVRETAFTRTQTSNDSDFDLKREQIIMLAFGVDWKTVQWSDLNKPFYSALAAQLVLFIAPQNIPSDEDVYAQAKFWRDYYNIDGSVEDFIRAAKYLEESTECDINPCANGGSCTPYADSFTCICPVGFTGDMCEESTECDMNPCANGGSCTPYADSFTCICPVGFTGDKCEESTECDITPCANLGSCTPYADSFTCICPVGFTGDKCENDESSSPTVTATDRTLLIALPISIILLIGLIAIVLVAIIIIFFHWKKREKHCQVQLDSENHIYDVPQFVLETSRSATGDDDITHMKSNVAYGSDGHIKYMKSNVAYGVIM